jgi:uncharacterized phage protein (TIGR02218 family)
MLYQRGCFVDKSLYAVSLSSISVISGTAITSITAGIYASGYFNGGFIEWQSDAGVIECTGIESHVSAILNLFGFSQGMDVATNFIAYPGCNRTADQCKDKFNNSLNFGGVKHMQGKSPFDGNPVF